MDIQGKANLNHLQEEKQLLLMQNLRQQKLSVDNNIPGAFPMRMRARKRQMERETLHLDHSWESYVNLERD